MTRIALMIALAGVAVTSAPASAKVCRTYSRGHHVKCHKAVRPSVNFNRKHPVKVVRCRTRTGHNVKC
jgi:hypothetical protein